jgi:hypothetical protein
MTEMEWLVYGHPRMMLDYVQPKASKRRLRLFAHACVKCLNLPPDERICRMVQTIASYADGQASWNELSAVRKLARLVARQAAQQPGRISYGAALAGEAAHPSASVAAEKVAGFARPEVLHDIFGNPFCHVVLDPNWIAWNDGTIPKLAQAIYLEDAFNRLPILADALEEAGCTDAAILDHCRQPGEHVRGCWVVDLLLGKE